MALLLKREGRLEEHFGERRQRRERALLGSGCFAGTDREKFKKGELKELGWVENRREVWCGSKTEHSWPITVKKDAVPPLFFGAPSLHFLLCLVGQLRTAARDRERGRGMGCEGSKEAFE